MMEGEFEGLWRELGAVGSSVPTHQALVTAYAAPPRAYHTLEHVKWGLRRIEQIGAAQDLEPCALGAVRWAMWFHDAVVTFGPENDDDEEHSARRAYRAARSAGLSRDFGDRVLRLVLSTALQADKLSWDEAILVDADLSMLGASESDFNVYEERVRKEWAKYGDKAYAEGRMAVLHRFLKKRRIFTTDYGRDKWEARAQVNLRRAIAQLSRSL